MEITKILQGLKGKALDLRDIELLRNAYKLQDENIKQLKTNNEALRESNEQLRQRVQERQAEVARLREEKESLAAKLQSDPREMWHESKELDENDCISLIESWMGSRPAEMNTRAINYADVDRELKLPRGSAERYIEQAAQKWGYSPVRKGAATIIFEEHHEEEGSSWIRSRET